MTNQRIAVRDGVVFDLDGSPVSLCVNPYDELELWRDGRLAEPLYDSDYVGDFWEILEPDGDSAQGVIAILVKRSRRYFVAQAAQGFIERWNVHDGARPVNLRAQVKRLGGWVSRAGPDLFPGARARLLPPPAGFQVLWREEDDENRRQELLALTIAARVTDMKFDGFPRTEYYDFSDTPNTRPDLHWFATLLMVPAEQAAFAHSMEFAYWIGEELNVDPARVHEAHQLWDEIAAPDPTPSSSKP
ncbi:hypothetical protein Achl_4265 (plasmid) [Pseudarthrobacter chlorophenolicus A6]|uniref:Uncharacterized protein n=1 Tax=Pseudarthrobacter chlorophenolicus (strain ATCC 700700 / DSM 12829 / CIP 107037 / JCM 12360 / KCTC 9906 / NCIMB 13794 / A6) TaxID=452863 RepID=B8HIG9_PSECP|nr:hypothetical protein [Pseudarthrobacter chlorophenolicus]ACL42216.1 hypothetical protein Achl_4265 [Pseudarthrobacter chlorophenolicus A6]SDQ15012.1 hypothetical protein SAMN04489738_0323 [Pseudarthrobacter chlorophenolicus]